ncbi:type II toxin-antitoxin system HicA family toxin [Kribbella sp. C-35]|uniref:type II toxin-antitoxin system HicA family toxin n=1 Tax=Kribbella sp. C-35 TaxID=2789276 RepID=UPI00397B971F
MPKKFRDADKELKKAGFTPSRQSGSHITYKNAKGKTVTVPKHGEIKTGTWSSIEKQAGLKQQGSTGSQQQAQQAQRVANDGVAKPGGKNAQGSGQQGQQAGKQGGQKPKRRLFGGRDGR